LTRPKNLARVVPKKFKRKEKIMGKINAEVTPSGSAVKVRVVNDWGYSSIFHLYSKDEVDNLIEQLTAIRKEMD
jgi:hypothetical protein